MRLIVLFTYFYSMISLPWWSGPPHLHGQTTSKNHVTYMYRLNNICQYSAWKLYLEPLKHTQRPPPPLSLSPFPSPPHHWSRHLIMQLPALGVRPTCTFVWVQEICACALDLHVVHLRAATRSWTTFKQRENVNNTRLLKQVWQRTIVSPLASMTTTFVYSPTILTNLEREKLKPGSMAKYRMHCPGIKPILW